MYLAAFSCFLIHFFTKRVKEERRQQKLVERHVCQVCKPLNELINKQGWPCALSKTLKWTHLHFSSFTFIRQPDPADDLKQNANNLNSFGRIGVKCAPIDSSLTILSLWFWIQDDRMIRWVTRRQICAPSFVNFEICRAFAAERVIGSRWMQKTFYRAAQELSNGVQIVGIWLELSRKMVAIKTPRHIDPRTSQTYSAAASSTNQQINVSINLNEELLPMIDYWIYRNAINFDLINLRNFSPLGGGRGQFILNCNYCQFN